ncbi:MAG: Holliday junction resolvase RuvX [Oligoflexia bacterium]|nr:Holliday junction resolvase RuvX [Oligoflexia bacterium]
MPRSMGLDFGDKRIGVAVSDEMGWTAQGIKHIQRKNLDYDLSEIENILSEYGNIDTIVVGMPYNMDGSEGERVRLTRVFIAQLKNKFNLPVVEIDERWSSKEAENLLISADVSRKKRKGSVDQIAASLILQTYLDQNKK